MTNLIINYQFTCIFRECQFSGANKYDGTHIHHLKGIFLRETLSRYTNNQFIQEEKERTISGLLQNYHIHNQREVI